MTTANAGRKIKIWPCVVWGTLAAPLLGIIVTQAFFLALSDWPPSNYIHFAGILVIVIFCAPLGALWGLLFGALPRVIQNRSFGLLCGVAIAFVTFLQSEHMPLMGLLGGIAGLALTDGLLRLRGHFTGPTSFFKVSAKKSAKFIAVVVLFSSITAINVRILSYETYESVRYAYQRVVFGKELADLTDQTIVDAGEILAVFETMPNVDCGESIQAIRERIQSNSSGGRFKCKVGTGLFGRGLFDMSTSSCPSLYGIWHYSNFGGSVYMVIMYEVAPESRFCDNGTITRTPKPRPPWEVPLTITDDRVSPVP